MKINFSHTDSFAGSVSHRPQSNLCQFGRGSDVEGCSDSHFHAWNIFDTCRIPIDSCAGGRLWGGGGGGGGVFGKFAFEFEAFRVRVSGSHFLRRGFRGFSMPRVWAYVKFLTVILMKLCKHTFTHSPTQRGWVKGGWCSPAADSRVFGVGHSLRMWVNHMHFEVRRRPTLCHAAFWLFN